MDRRHPSRYHNRPTLRTLSEDESRAALAFAVGTLNKLRVLIRAKPSDPARMRIFNLTLTQEAERAISEILDLMEGPPTDGHSLDRQLDEVRLWAKEAERFKSRPWR